MNKYIIENLLSNLYNAYETLNEAYEFADENSVNDRRKETADIMHHIHESKVSCERAIWLLKNERLRKKQNA